MSRENVEIVRRIYDQGMSGRDPDGLLDLKITAFEWGRDLGGALEAAAVRE